MSRRTGLRELKDCVASQSSEKIGGRNLSGAVEAAGDGAWICNPCGQWESVPLHWQSSRKRERETQRSVKFNFLDAVGLLSSS
jgi:hypothetical protein